ncbi:MAG: transposase domain-containing protein [Paracoccus sp. (in: a-proteobacteria)]|uniref:transposase domain-containing protein n=1 Tax=Paracoccus sp. TaxID=267 RepID=UPI00391AC9CB
MGWAADFASRDGRVEIDSNNVENLIRPVALTRKNALFAGHDEGGRSWARIASLIATAKINGVEPFAYLTATLEAFAAGHPQARIDDLLPWNFKPSSWKQVRRRRRLQRTACSRTSGENLVTVLPMMLYPTQELEPPANPERFATLGSALSQRLPPTAGLHAGWTARAACGASPRWNASPVTKPAT